MNKEGLKRVLWNFKPPLSEEQIDSIVDAIIQLESKSQPHTVAALPERTGKARKILKR